MKHYEAIQYSCQNHLFIVNKRYIGITGKPCLSGRGQIKEFTPTSGSRMRRYLRTCVAEYSVFATLTYPHSFPIDGAESKEHLRRFLQELQRYEQRDPVCGMGAERWSAFWFMEFQERGAIHYHIFLNRRYPKHWISRLWYNIVGSEDDRHLAAGTRIESIRSGRRGICSYAAKYAAKQAQKVVPESIINCGRFWGVAGARTTVSAATTVRLDIPRAPAVQRAINTLKDLTKHFIELGEAKKLATKAGCVVIYLQTERAKLSIVRAMQRLELANAIYDIDKHYTPELSEPENDHSLYQPAESNQATMLHSARCGADCSVL